MPKFAEGDPSLTGYRLASPNRDRWQNARPRLGRVTNPEVDVKGQINKVSIREVPSVSDIVKATRGVNSSSAQISLGFFDVMNVTAEHPQKF